jgi:hypothetical protein
MARHRVSRSIVEVARSMRRTSLKKKRRGNMLVKWILFDTKIGELLLVLLERHVGLAVVQSDWLATQRSGEPKAVTEAQ